MTTTTRVLLTIPARFERATPGFGEQDPRVSARSATERAFPCRPTFMGFDELSRAALSAEYRRLTAGPAQTRHTAS